MIKTIKTTKQLRLDELIKYVWENDGSLFKEYKTIMFHTKDDKSVTFDDTGLYESNNWFDPEDLFTVEEPITKDTEFNYLVYVSTRKGKSSSYATYFQTINTILEHSGSIDSIRKIYALIDDKLEIIWERD